LSSATVIVVQRVAVTGVVTELDDCRVVRVAEGALMDSNKLPGLGVEPMVTFRLPRPGAAVTGIVTVMVAVPVGTGEAGVVGRIDTAPLMSVKVTVSGVIWVGGDRSVIGKT
jgi:hypothetical protein